MAGYGGALAQALQGAQAPPPEMPPLPAGPPIGAPPVMPPMPPPPMAAAAPPSAQALHETQSKKFLHDAIADFHRGGITRGQLAEAVAAQDAYDYVAWKKASVVHPSRAIEHNVAAEEPAPIAPAGPAPAGPM